MSTPNADKICALLRAVQTITEGGIATINTQDAEKAEDMGLLEVGGPQRYVLTEAGKAWLIGCAG